MEDNTEAFNKLENIKNIYGIEVIQDFLNYYNKKQRKKQKKVNTYEEVSIRVYMLMKNNEYSKTRAYDRIAEILNASPNTIRNHCMKFDKIAKEFDYYSFGALIDECIHLVGYYDAITEVSRLNNISYEVAEIYYFKYKNEKKPQNKNIDKFKKLYCLISHEIPF